MRPDVAAQTFWARTERADNGCLHWQGSVDADGYGKIKRLWNGERVFTAHRYAFLLAGGVVPTGFTIDHTCHNGDLTCSADAGCLHRRCIEPSHLEAVSRRQNTLRGSNVAAINARKTVCSKGHPYNEANTGRRGNRRYCRACEPARKARKAQLRMERRVNA